MRHVLLAFLLCAASKVMSCEYPDQGNLPLRRAVSLVKYLPQTEAWAAEMQKAGAHVTYALLLDRTIMHNGRCYWTVEVKANGELWRRFLVSPQGNLWQGGTADRPAS